MMIWKVVGNVRKRRKNRIQVRLVVGLSICLLLIMTIGYAAFSTNLTLTAKGNIHKLTTVSDLKSNIVTAGDGLYVDTYEDGRYIYRGGNPNNYIKLDSDLWRIVSIEKDGTMKLKKQDTIGNIAFDTIGNRNVGTSTYCVSADVSGCNAWSIVSGNFVNNGISGTVTQDASLNTYLNTTFYNSLSEKIQNLIVAKTFSTGSIAMYDDLSAIVEKEKKYKWDGKIALISVSDYFKASINTRCNPNENGFFISESIDKVQDNYPCSLENFSFTPSGIMFFLTPSERSSDRTFYINSYGAVNHNSVSSNRGAIFPSLYLKSDILLLGSGTESDPYIIK